MGSTLTRALRSVTAAACLSWLAVAGAQSPAAAAFAGWAAARAAERAGALAAAWAGFAKARPFWPRD